MHYHLAPPVPQDNPLCILDNADWISSLDIEVARLFLDFATDLRQVPLTLSRRRFILPSE